LSSFSIECTRCSRLAEFLADQRAAYPDYHARPVPSFGDADARLLIVGLAPGMHGANATGRPFTGDHAGIILYRTLHETGFASHPESISCDDDLVLSDCRITNAVRCLPPQNKPVGEEVAQCNEYLLEEIRELPQPGLILALGGIAHKAVIKALKLRQASFPFGHGTEYELEPGLTLLSSYHCSRYNTQTRRLTEPMFREVLQRAREHVTTQAA
jgi:uracil-DNA glycosylase family 4